MEQEDHRGPTITFPRRWLLLAKRPLELPDFSTVIIMFRRKSEMVCKEATRCSPS
jgi:hypothetical protein